MRDLVQRNTCPRRVAASVHILSETAAPSCSCCAQPRIGARTCDMSGAALFIGLDVGTQGCKAIVYNAKENKVVSRGAYAYEILKTDVPGRAEQHPSLWIEVSLAQDPVVAPHPSARPWTGIDLSRTYSLIRCRPHVSGGCSSVESGSGLG